MARTTIYAANWKMHKTIGEVEAFVQTFSNYDLPTGDHEVVVFCSFTGLPVLRSLASHLGGTYGAQNMYFEVQGAFTGEVSPAQLRDVGCTWVLVGHSERREIFGESDELCRKKVQAAFAHGLKPMLCVGETLDERRAGKLFDKVKTQVVAGLDGVPAERLADMAVAYEPIWAIGTGETATGAQADEMCRYLRGEVAKLYGADAAGTLRILYGGSVKPGNAAELMAFPDIDGALIGGASLKPDSFRDIIVAGSGK